MFIRVSNVTIINTDHILMISELGDLTITMIDNTELTVLEVDKEDVLRSLHDGVDYTSDHLLKERRKKK